MKTILILDVETTGLDPAKDQVIELAWALWSVEHRALIDCSSQLFAVAVNAAESINGISGELARLEGGSRRGDLPLGARYDAVIAHNAEFDRSFIEDKIVTPLPHPWICSMEDLKWPRPSPSRSLTAIALAHNCAVVAAHRAINDVLLLSRMFEAVPDIDVRLEAALEHAKLPKAWLTALVPFDRKDEAKAAGFQWEPQRKEWRRWMTIADAAEFPFQVRADKEPVVA